MGTSGPTPRKPWVITHERTPHYPGVVGSGAEGASDPKKRGGEILRRMIWNIGPRRCRKTPLTRNFRVSEVG